MPLQNQPFMQPVNGAGKPYPGALAYYYVTGTATAADVYSASDLMTAHAHPVVADAAGVFPDIYTDPAITYRLMLRTASGALIADIDPISGGSAIGSADLSDGAVTQVKIADGAVSAAKLAPQSVGNSTMASMAAGTVKGNVSGLTALPGDVGMTALYDALIRPIFVGRIYAAGYGVTSDDYYGLICDGRSLSKADPTYARLFARIGVTWGSVDSDHFTLPDLRGYGLVGEMRGRGLDDDLDVGESHADQMQGHKHPFSLDFGGSFTGAYIQPTTSFINTGTYDTGVPKTDGANGTPRTGKTTHGREAGVVFMIHY